MKLLLTAICLLISTLYAYNQDTLPYFQDFEGATFLPTGWEVFGSNSNEAWQHSTTIGAYGASSGCAYFDNFTNDLTGSFYGMRSVLLDLSSAIQPMLSFDVAYARKNAVNSDRLGIWYSFNGTTGWVNLINYQDGTLTTAADQNTYFTPANSEWDSIIIDLTQFAGSSLIRFAFESNCSFGNVMYVDNVHFYEKQVEDTTGIAELASAPFSLFPNPTTDVISISTHNSKPGIIQIHNMLGQKALPSKLFLNDVTKVDLSSLNAGIYIVHIEQQGRVHREKVVLRK